MPSATTIYFTPELRAQWPSPLAEQWASAYPALFDENDLQNTRLQPRNHFCEWFAAIHLFHRDGLYSLVEKYLFTGHARKTSLLNRLLSDSQLTILHDIHTLLRSQPPDLLVFTPDLTRFWFAEIKGPGDKIRPRQLQSHAAIQKRLRVPVELITVLAAKSRSFPT